MKKYIKCFCLGAVAFMAASCAKESRELDGGLSGNVPLNITVAVNELTRASGFSFDEGDQLGLYAFRHKEDVEESFMGVRQMDNVKLTFKSGMPKADAPLYFPKYDDKTDFYMYFPYDEASIQSGDTRLPIVTYWDQSELSYFKRSDKMLASVLGVSKSPAPVEFRLKRMMSKIDIRLKPGNGYQSASDLLSSEVVLKNIPNNTVINCLTQEIGEASTPKDIIPYGSFSVPYGEDYAEGISAIIPPQTMPKGKVLFTVTCNDRKYNGTLSEELVFEPGKRYVFTVTMNRVIDGDQVFIDAQVTDWTEGLNMDGGTTEVDPEEDLAYVIDIDGNEYRIVKMGAQKWLGENLKVTRFNDGTPIPNLEYQEDWDKAGENDQPAYCAYDNDPSKIEKYGLLYNWHVTRGDKICPEGWRVPTADDFRKLISFLGDNPGVKIKATEGWYDVNMVTKPEYQGTDDYGFTAIPVGNRAYQEGFERIDMYGEWWTINGHESYASSAYIYFVYAKYKDIRSLYHLKSDGHGIRCIKK